MLDADIIMIGEVLDQPFLLNNDNDVIVNADEEDVYAPWFKHVYYDINAIQKHDPTFEYPGYVFNCGQLFLKAIFYRGSSLRLILILQAHLRGRIQ